jgi:hypothetical protein
VLPKGGKKRPQIQQQEDKFELVDIDLDNDNVVTSSGASSDKCDSTSSSDRLSSDSDNNNNNSDNRDTSTSEEESCCESTLPSLEPINPFVRHNPARRPINTNGQSMEVRRSVRLGPKTVSALASKFDNLLTVNEAASKKQPNLQEKDKKLCKRDITKIIGTLEKLDEEARKASLILQKNKKMVASAASKPEVTASKPEVTTSKPEVTSSSKKIDINTMMQSAKSLLEEIELPSQELLENPPDQEEPQQQSEVVVIEPQEPEVTVDKLTSTHKYLQNLQKLAKENAETGCFKTSESIVKSSWGGATTITIGGTNDHPVVNPVEPVKPNNEAGLEFKLEDSEKKSFHGSIWSALNHSYMELDHHQDGKEEYDDVLNNYLSLAEKRCQSEDNLSQMTYDPVGEPVDHLVTARPAIVTEDQFDSISFYDDIGVNHHHDQGLGDLYESIAGSILNLAKKNSSMEDMYSTMLFPDKKPDMHQHHLGGPGVLNRKLSNEVS